MAGIIGTLVRNSAQRVKDPTAGLMGAGLVMNAGFTGMDYMMRKSEGASTGEAALSAVGTFALWELAPALALAQMGYQLAEGLGKVGTEAYFAGKSKRLAASHGFGHSFTDTAVRQTMRQRAMQAAQESGTNVRQVLGNEARLLHRNNRW